MNILETIIERKRAEVTKKKWQISIRDLEKQLLFQRKTFSFQDNLTDESKTGIIAEFKRKSPSKGIINATATVENVTLAYEKFGASCISVLTDEYFFGGSLTDLVGAREREIPLLRKDFIIDEYQIVESKAFGADIILLIAACLSKNEVKHFSEFAKELGLGVLLEIHNERELDHICEWVDVVGVNNRNLKNFEVNINHSIELGNRIPGNKMKIAESGIHDADTIRVLKTHGFNGFLMGEKFMREQEPGVAFQNFTNELKKIILK